MISLEAREIRENIESCLDRVEAAEVDPKNAQWSFGAASQDERDELRGYMLVFLADVDRDYEDGGG